MYSALIQSGTSEADALIAEAVSKPDTDHTLGASGTVENSGGDEHSMALPSSAVSHRVAASLDDLDINDDIDWAPIPFDLPQVSHAPRIM